jgi:hypothetical protein
MFYPSDLLPLAAHVPLPYIMGYDLFPLTTLNDKEHWLGKAAKEGWCIVLEHDPRVEALTARCDDKGRVVVNKMGMLEDVFAAAD